MANTQSVEINKLEKLREAWLPAVELLFGEAVVEAQFDGFEVNHDIAKPAVLFEHPEAPFRYKIQMPMRSFTNDVMLLADVIQEMVRGLFPIGLTGKEAGRDVPTLCEGIGVYGAVTAIRQVFGEETLDSYLDALREQAFPYYDAFSYVAILLADDPQAIKKLRALKPFLYDLEKSDFVTADVQVQRKFIDVLLFTFRA